MNWVTTIGIILAIAGIAWYVYNDQKSGRGRMGGY